jgi:hypothetical protein
LVTDMAPNCMASARASCRSTSLRTVPVSVTRLRSTMM